MNQLEKGFVFADERGVRFLITGEAFSHQNSETVYLCQEMEPPYRQMIWTAQEIAVCAGSGVENQYGSGYSGMAMQADTGSGAGEAVKSGPDTMQKESVKKEEAGNRFVGSVEIDDRYRRRIRRQEQENEVTRIQNQMIAFLDADTYGEKLEILASMKGKATETMLESMALSMDYQTGGSSAEEIYYSLERFLKTRRKYEGNRLR